MESVSQLVAALSSYSGTMIVVSHDDDFLSRIGVQRRVELSGGDLRETAGT